MSEKSKMRRAKKAAMQEKEGKNGMKWLRVTMVVLTLAVIGYAMVLMQ